MDTVLVIMLKDKHTGFLEKEITSLNIKQNENLIVNLFVQHDDFDNLELHLKLSMDKDVLDWEYYAIYDYYDISVFDGVVNNIIEIDNLYNPTWELIFDYIDNKIEMENKISRILDIHLNEINNVYSAIKDKESEYKENE